MKALGRDRYGPPKVLVIDYEHEDFTLRHFGAGHHQGKVVITMA